MRLVQLIKEKVFVSGGYANGRSLNAVEAYEFIFKIKA